jgi:hypothetical protein
MHLALATDHTRLYSFDPARHRAKGSRPGSLDRVHLLGYAVACLQGLKIPKFKEPLHLPVSLVRDDDSIPAPGLQDAAGEIDRRPRHGEFRLRASVSNQSRACADDYSDRRRNAQRLIVQRMTASVPFIIDGQIGRQL